jgi:hypothetical protein
MTSCGGGLGNGVYVPGGELVGMGDGAGFRVGGFGGKGVLAGAGGKVQLNGGPQSAVASSAAAMDDQGLQGEGRWGS